MLETLASYSKTYRTMMIGLSQSATRTRGHGTHKDVGHDPPADHHRSDLRPRPGDSSSCRFLNDTDMETRAFVAYFSHRWSSGPSGWARRVALMQNKLRNIGNGSVAHFGLQQLTDTAFLVQLRMFPWARSRRSDSPSHPSMKG